MEAEGGGPPLKTLNLMRLFIGLVDGLDASVLTGHGFDRFLVIYCILMFVRTTLIPCDSNHLAKNLSIPLVNQWPTLQPYNSQDDIKLFRRFVIQNLLADTQLYILSILD